MLELLQQVALERKNQTFTTAFQFHHAVTRRQFCSVWGEHKSATRCSAVDGNALAVATVPFLIIHPKFIPLKYTIIRADKLSVQNSQSFHVDDACLTVKALRLQLSRPNAV